MKNKSAGRQFLVSGLGFLVIIGILAIAPLVEPPTAQHSFQAITLSNSIFFPMILDQSGVYDWLQFNGDERHTGNNTFDPYILPGDVSSLHLLFQVALPDVADGAPAYLSGISTSSGTNDLIFVTTRNGHITARDAHTGALVWDRQYGPSGCLVNNNPVRNLTCWTTSSPAIDPNRQYVYSYGLDGFVHKYQVNDGTEIHTGGWPELTTLKNYDEKGSSALSIATAKNGTSYLYVAQSGYYTDAGDYQGHLTAINLTDGTQKVFNAVCSDKTVHFVDSRITTGQDCSEVQAAIWARPGVVYSPDTDLIYMATGNGTFNSGQFDWGDTVLALHPDGTGLGNGNPVDSYTPTNFQSLQDLDLDLASAAPALLPPSGGKYPHLAVQGGKDSILRLLNLDNLSNQNGPGHIGGEVFSVSVAMGGQIWTQPAIWTNLADLSTWIYASNNLGTAAYQLNIDSSGNPSLVLRWTQGPSTSPLVVNGVVFTVYRGQITALDPTSGQALWVNNQVGRIHWESPVVANGIVYITDESGNLTAFALP